MKYFKVLLLSLLFILGTQNVFAGVIVDGVPQTDGKSILNPDIDGGTIDGTVIGGTTPAAGSFTDIVATGAIDTAYSTVASHATTSAIWAATNVINFTGTETITDFPAADQAGAQRYLICAGATVFTHGGSITVKGGATYTAAANEIVIVTATATTAFHVASLSQSGAVLESDFDANTILRATTDDTPQAMAIAEQTIVGRKTGANIDDLSATEVRAILNVADGATANSADATLLDRANHTGGQASSTITALATDKILGRATAGAGVIEEIACTAAGRAILDDADAAAQIVTLGAATAPTVYAKTTSATLTATEVSGLNTLHNDGAGGEVILTWLGLVTGQEGMFYVNDAQYLQIKAPAATTIRIGAVTTAANGYVRSNVVGNWIRIKAMPDGLVVMGYGGTWTYDE